MEESKNPLGDHLAKKVNEKQQQLSTAAAVTTAILEKRGREKAKEKREANEKKEAAEKLN